MDANRLREASFGSDRIELLTRIEMEERGSMDSRLGMLSPLLLPHPDDDEFCSSDGDFVSPRLIGGMDYIGQNIRMAMCFLVLVAGYTVQRLACHAGYPSDCLRTIDYYEFFSDITTLSLYSLALGWFIGISERSRFNYLFNRHQWYAGATFFLTPPIYSAISNIDALKFDLTDLESLLHCPLCLLIVTLGITAISAVIGWHLMINWRSPAPRASFLVYLFTRIVMLGWFTSAAVICATHGTQVHLHHLYIGWSLALWCNLNLPVSAVALAIGAGIFVQGIGAYSFAPVFTPSGCFETSASKVQKCTFWGDSPFTLQVCGSNGAVAVEHECVYS